MRSGSAASGCRGAHTRRRMPGTLEQAGGARPGGTPSPGGMPSPGRTPRPDGPGLRGERPGGGRRGQPALPGDRPGVPERKVVQSYLPGARAHAGHFALLYYFMDLGRFSPPIFPPFSLMASRAVAGGGPSSPPTAYPAAIAFPSQNVSCSLPRSLGAGVQAALPPSPPGSSRGVPSALFWGAIPKRSPCSRRENLCLIAWALRRWVDQPGEGGIKPSGILIFLRQHKQWPNFNC